MAGKDFMGEREDCCQNKGLEADDDFTQGIHVDDSLYRAVLNNMSDVLFITDDNGILTFVSPNIASIFDYSPPELLRSHISTLRGIDGLFSPDELNETGEISNIEQMVFDKHGQAHRCLISVKRVAIQQGTILYSCRDLSHYKEFSLELQDVSHRLGERVKELNCMYGLSRLIERDDTTLEHIFTGVLKLIPPSWQYPDLTCSRLIIGDDDYHTANFKETIWKQSSDIHIHGKSVGRLEIFYLQAMPEADEGVFLKEERDLLEAITERLGRVIERKEAEAELLSLNTELEERVMARTIDLVVMNTQLQQEIAARLDAEEQVIAFRIERERMKILTNFITQTSHEFRTPLSIINSSVYLLKRMNDPVKISKQFAKIETQVQEMTRLVDALLTMAKLDGISELKKEEFDLADLVETIRKNHQEDFENQEIQSSVTVPGESLLIHGDIDYIHRALEAIVDNAMKFTKPGGAINFHVTIDGGNVLIDIVDSGCGIKEDDLPHIFKLFYRADKAGTVRGFGLGLPIAKRIFELHGGSITVNSVFGEGSSFRLSLPLQ